MVKVFHQLHEAGYKPHINYQAGRIANILCKFYYRKLKKYIKYNIVSQCLSQERIDEDVITDNEEINFFLKNDSRIFFDSSFVLVNKALDARAFWSLTTRVYNI